MSTPSLHILVANNDHPYSVLLQKTLTGRGHSVVISDSGGEASDRLWREQFDIVFMDYKMKDTSGMNVLQWMYRRMMDTPVIFISEFESDKIFEEGNRWGVMEYFAKSERDTVRLPILVEQTHRRYTSKNKEFK